MNRMRKMPEEHQYRDEKVSSLLFKNGHRVYFVVGTYHEYILDGMQIFVGMEVSPQMHKITGPMSEVAALWYSTAE